jgi:hypothetical protein
MGGFVAGRLRWIYVVPFARTTVVVRLLAQGLSDNPGRHSHTVEEVERLAAALPFPTS